MNDETIARQVLLLHHSLLHTAMTAQLEGTAQMKSCQIYAPVSAPMEVNIAVVASHTAQMAMMQMTTWRPVLLFGFAYATLALFTKFQTVLRYLRAICAAAVVNGFIKDGVNNWLPKYLTERFSLPASLSIILTLLLPLFSILGTVIGRWLYCKLHNHTLICAIEYGFSCLLLGGILLFHSAGALIPMMVLFILLACMMASVNNIVTSMFPLDNRDRINSGLLAGTLDTVCYVGSSIAGTLLGLLAQNQGWGTVFTLLLVLSAVAALVCLVFSLPERKKRSKQA